MPSGVRQFAFSVDVGPTHFLKYKKAKGWGKAGSEKFKWKLVANGSKGKVKGVIKYKKKNGLGLWTKRKTNLSIQFLGNIYDNNTCTVIENLSFNPKARKSKSNNKTMRLKYKTSKPFFINVNDPVAAKYEAGNISGTYDVFD